MRLLRSVSWRIVALHTATLAALWLGTVSLRCQRKAPPPHRGLTTAVSTVDAGAAVQKLRKEAEDRDPETLTNLAAALLTDHPVAWPSDSSRVSTTLEALVAARNAIAQSPTMGTAHFQLAVALARLGFTSEARIEFERAATLALDAAWSAEARRRAREVHNVGPLAIAKAAADYVNATDSPEARIILREYIEARTRTHDRLQWNRADTNGRLERAAELFETGLFEQRLPRVFLQVAITLSPRDQGDIYMQRYLIAGGLYRRGRSGEGVALLRALDADVFRAHGQDGWTAQIVCEEAIHSIARRSPANALAILRDAFHGSMAKGEPWLTALYANLVSEVRTSSLELALRKHDLPMALAYTDASVFSPQNGGRVRKEMMEEVHQRAPDFEIAEDGDRLIQYGDLLEYLKVGRAVAAGDAGTRKVEVARSEEGDAGILEADRDRVLEVQRALTPDAAIVEYATARDRVIAFVIRSNDLQAVPLHPGVAEIKNAADAMRHADDQSFAAASGQLYDLILAPVAARLDGVSTISFVVYQDLAGIPFGALLDVNSGQFLIERVAVVHSQSTFAAISASRALKPASNASVLAIAATDFDHERFPRASPLPAARGEAGSIATLSQCARLLAGPAATPEAIQRQLAENAVIHYAGHVVRRGADVWLPLMPAGGRDGLSATEIARLPLMNARVVVLAACRGASQGQADDVMPSMADAFLVAGVPSVIASSYDVDDTDAPATMVRLHTYLRDGNDAAQALRKTTIDELHRGRAVLLSLRFMAMGGTASLAN
ncbi:MAG TPA: CHAT domain-containing protein [Thermoanaerobaculia bacterium]|nr:CHAT domain-containing protein [Thermoanaerobaculia bacterium]